MSRYTFTTPQGDTQPGPPPEELRRLILGFPSAYWREGAGDASLKHENGAEVLLLPNESHGMYLKFSASGFREDDELLSLHDTSKLAEVAECSEEWFASVGLFLPVEDAWAAISDFLTSGQASGKVMWVSPVELPDGSNW